MSHMWRRVQECGFSTRYRDDVDFVYYIKMINVLAFLLETDVDGRFEDLLLTNFFMENQDDITEIADYLKDGPSKWHLT